MQQLSIPDSTYQRLLSRAAELNTTPDLLILEAIKAAVPAVQLLPLTGEAWERAMAEWRARAESREHRYPLGFVLDDSRETIYREREDAQIQ